MLSGIACGWLLLLLRRGLAVDLAMNAFPRLILLALGAVPLLVNLLATNKTLVVIVAPLCFYPSGLGTLACVVFACSASDLVSRRVAVCRRAASLASITAWSRRCWSMMLNSASGSCTTRLNFIFLSTLRRNSSGSIPAVITSTSTLPCFSVCCGPQGFTTSVSPLSGRFFSQGTLLHKHPAVYR